MSFNGSAKGECFLHDAGRGIENDTYAPVVRNLIACRADVTDRDINADLLKKLVAAYASSELRLAELNELKNRFLGMAAHDMRSPLSSIKGFSELLLEDNPTGEQGELLSMIHSTSGQLLALINDLLDISVIESGHLEIKKTDESLNDLIAERVRIAGVMAKKKGTRIGARLQGIPDFLFDRARIAQVIDNLLGNAVKFAPPSSRVLVTVRRTQGAAEVSVRDRGPGIEAHERDRLFSAFHKLTARPTGGETSTGLGLAIASKIVAAHGGTISVRPRAGGGSIFFFTLPMEVQP